MALETFLGVQKYLTVILLVVAGVLWARTRDYAAIAIVRSQRLYTLMLLLTLPFLVRAMTFIPENISLLLQHVLFTLIFFVLLASSVKLYRANMGERTKMLRELVDKAKVHPIRLEFARHVVLPELRALQNKEQDLIRRERALLAQQRNLEKREHKIDTKIASITDIKNAVREERVKKEQTAADMVAKRRDAERRVRSIESKEKGLTNKFEELESDKIKIAREREHIKRQQIGAQKEYEKKIEVLKERMNQEVDVAREEALLQAVRKEASLEKKEQSLKNAEQELGAMRATLKERERTMKDLEAEKKSIEREIARLTKERDLFKEEEQHIRQELAQLDEQRKELSLQRKTLLRDRDEFMEQQDRVKRMDTNIEKRQGVVERQKEKLRQREVALMKIEDQLVHQQREVERRRRELERRDVDVSKKETHLQKRMATFQIEQNELEEMQALRREAKKGKGKTKGENLFSW